MSWSYANGIDRQLTAMGRRTIIDPSSHHIEEEERPWALQT